MQSIISDFVILFFNVSLCGQNVKGCLYRIIIIMMIIIIILYFYIAPTAIVSKRLIYNEIMKHSQWPK